MRAVFFFSLLIWIRSHAITLYMRSTCITYYRDAYGFRSRVPYTHTRFNLSLFSILRDVIGTEYVCACRHCLYYLVREYVWRYLSAGYKTRRLVARETPLLLHIALNLMILSISSTISRINTISIFMLLNYSDEKKTKNKFFFFSSRRRKFPNFFFFFFTSNAVRTPEAIGMSRVLNNSCWCLIFFLRRWKTNLLIRSAAQFQCIDNNRLKSPNDMALWWLHTSGAPHHWWSDFNIIYI